MGAKPKKRGYLSPALCFFVGVAVGMLFAPPKTISITVTDNNNTHHYHWDDSMPEGEVVEVE